MTISENAILMLSISLFYILLNWFCSLFDILAFTKIHTDNLLIFHNKEYILMVNFCQLYNHIFLMDIVTEENESLSCLPGQQLAKKQGRKFGKRNSPESQSRSLSKENEDTLIQKIIIFSLGCVLILIILSTGNSNETIGLKERDEGPNFKQVQEDVVILQKKKERNFDSKDQSWCKNFNQMIKNKTQYLKNLKNNQGLLVCNHLNLYDDYNYQQKILFYRGAYDIFLKGCQQQINSQYSVHNQNIMLWNLKRDTVQWSLRHLEEGDKVLIEQKHFNLIQLIIISKIIGQRGKLSLYNMKGDSTCLKANIEFHNIKNFQLSNNQTVQNEFNVFIGSFVEFPQKMKSLLKNQKKQIKIFYFLENTIYLSKITSGYKVEHLQLNNKYCNKLIVNNLTNQPGFYSITKKRTHQAQQPRFKIIDQPISQDLKKKYRQYLQSIYNEQYRKYEQLNGINKSCGCINENTSRTLNGSEVLSIYGSKLYKISLNQLIQLEKQRQTVQWVRLRSKNNSTIFYYMKTNFNLLSIIEISSIIKNGSLILVCSNLNCKEQVYIQKQYYGLKNINIIDQLNEQNLLKRALKSNLIISDEQDLISSILQTQYLSSSYLLAKFNQVSEKSMKVFGKILPTHQLNQVSLYKFQCQGLQFLHYFWNSDHINYYYQVRLSKRVVFMYWSGQVRTIPFRRKHLFEEAIYTSKVQMKILNSKLFYLIQKQQYPIHQAFQYLSKTQTTDYVRSYVTHHFGGGYVDTKHLHFDWNPYFDQLERMEDKYAIGYNQIKAFDVGCYDQPGQIPCKIVKNDYEKIIGNAQFIYKKYTKATFQLMDRTNKILDQKLEKLKKNPGTHPRDRFGMFGSKYPMRWGEIGNQLRTRVSYKQSEKYLKTMPHVIMEDYLPLY